MKWCIPLWRNAIKPLCCRGLAVCKCPPVIPSYVDLLWSPPVPLLLLPRAVKAGAQTPTASSLGELVRALWADTAAVSGMGSSDI